MRTRLALVVVGALLLGVGCAPAATPEAGPGPASSGPASSGAASSGPARSGAGTTTPSTASAAASSAPPAPDPRSLRGPSTAAKVPELTPLPTPTPQLPATVTGADGHAVTITDVSRSLALDLYGTLTETVLGLGLGDLLVGRSNTNTEASVADLPVVTQNGHELNIEAILALKPTFVIMDTTMGPPEVPQQLRAAGVTVLVVSSERGVGLITGQITLVATAFGVPAAGQQLVADVTSRLQGAQKRIAELRGTHPPLSMAFLYVRGTGSVFFVMGKGSGADDLIGALGGNDAATRAGINDIVPATAESVIRLNPEVILTMTGGLASTGGVDGLVARPGISQTTAGANKRIIDMADGEVLSFGPSYPEVLVSLATAIYQP